VKVPALTSDISRRRTFLRWGAVVLLFVLVFLYEALLRPWLMNQSGGLWFTLDGVILFLAGVLAYLLIDRTEKWREEREELQKTLIDSEQKALQASQRQRMIFQISQMFNQASDEEDVLQITLQFSQNVLGASGATYVPLDERLQPMHPLSVGVLPAQVTDDWLQYLASPAVRQRCSSCQNYGHFTAECPLLEGPFSPANGIYCLPFTRNDQEYGVLNLYLAEEAQLSADSQELLEKIIGEATLALEGIRLRKRELKSLRELQSLRERTDLDGLLSSLLQNLNETLDADYSLLSIKSSKLAGGTHSVSHGDLPSGAYPLVEGALQSVISSGEPVLLGDVSGEQAASSGIRALMAVPLLFRNETVMGGLVVAGRRVKLFNRRQLSMLQTVSSQAALVVQNVNLMAELEYKTIIDERTRLAREIHDGLAQTLGFLKLKMTQMKNYVEQSDYERVKETIPICYDTLADAYQDVRQAIDGLRITSDTGGLDGWLRQMVSEFQENSGLTVHICEPIEDANLPAEIHAQLIRIVQEALNNIRRHAKSNQAWVSCQEIDGDLILEVRDDGVGFDLDDIPGPSQHGLQGMRERAELMGADFQITSRPFEGAVVRVRLPLGVIGDKL
jgi:two-component system, NarL family, nitrate/nitrite sensor histidine kinase NarX